MTEKALITRAWKITNVSKLKSFVEVWTSSAWYFHAPCNDLCGATRQAAAELFSHSCLVAAMCCIVTFTRNKLYRNRAVQHNARLSICTMFGHHHGIRQLPFPPSHQSGCPSSAKRACTC